MALSLRPNGVKNEVEYIIHGYNLYDPAENLFNGSMTAVYNGTFKGTFQRKTLPRAYWASGTGASLNYLDIEFLDDVRIWDAGGDAFPTQVGELNIYTNTEGVKGILYGQLLKYTQSSYNSTSPNWQTVAELPKGRYRIESTGTSVRISNEWYLEKLSATNKTLILHDGEYKKYINEVIVDDETVNKFPQLPLDSNNSDITVVSASAERTAYDNYAYKAFDGTDSFWYTGGGSNHWIKIDMKKFIVVKSLKISSTLVSGSTYSLKDFTLYGSNNDVDYDVIYSGTLANNGTIQEFLTNSNTKGYRYLKLGNLTSYSTESNLGIVELSFYGQEGIEVKSWQVVSSTIPTQEKFLSDGMDSLSPLLDRRVETLEPQPMMDKSEILQVGEEGKAFSKTIDLKRYLDIRSIKVDVK